MLNSEFYARLREKDETILRLRAENAALRAGLPEVARPEAEVDAIRAEAAQAAAPVRQSP